MDIACKICNHGKVCMYTTEYIKVGTYLSKVITPQDVQSPFCVEFKCEHFQDIPPMSKPEK